MAETAGLEPGFLDLHLLVHECKVEIASEIRVDAGGHDQFGMVEREAARGAVVMAGWQKTADVAVLDVVQMRIAALQDERDVRVEAGADRGFCRGGRFSLSAGVGCLGFGFLQPGFQRLNARFVGGFQFLQFGAQGVEVVAGKSGIGDRHCGHQKGGT